ncbi:MAG TPA: N-acetylmuramoyl-L-alanine amidase [Thermoanaerobaculia bacterium]
MQRDTAVRVSCRRAVFHAVLPLLVFLLALPAAVAAPTKTLPALSSRTVRVPVEDGAVVTLTEEGIFLEAVPRRGEGLYAFTRRLCGDDRLAPQVVEANGGTSEMHAGMRYRVPFALLSDEWQRRTAGKLFPQDKGQADGWRHQARGVGPLRRESLWQLSQWFTGTGENFRAIREYNELMDDDVPSGTAVVIPSELLRPAFRAVLPVPETPYHLDYGRDKDGEYAIYRLRPGEALYSSVVVRFTGRVHAVDVNALAADIAHRSGIADVTDIPIGYRVKIPFDLLQPEFLPEGNPRRVEYEASLRASAQFSNQVRARGLEGITVILDAGHGGQDSGASMGGVWESLYVYDIAVRTQRLLETHTLAKVHVTTRDGSEHRVHDADVLPFSRGHSVLTTPPYPIADAKVGVNLRWYLANSVYRRAVQRQDSDPQKVVFLSIHADSLHPSLRGAMAYIPAADMRGGSFSKSGPVYASRREVQESPTVIFPWEERVKSEGLSRELAKQIIASFDALGLAVHPFKPVRDKIIRNKSTWVPAVLRYNSVPSKILLEVCNLANEQDRKLVQTRAYRQKVAEAIVRGVLAYYGQGSDAPGLPVAKTAK